MLYTYNTFSSSIHLLMNVSAVPLCHGDSAALILQAQVLHMFQHFIDGVDVRVSQLIGPGPGW